MKLPLILCAVCGVVAFVCICYGIICLYKSHRQAKEQEEKERASKYLYLSTSWLMWADLCGIKISNITSNEESKFGFNVVFSKRSSNKIEELLKNSTITNILSGHFEKLDNGRYAFISNSIFNAQHDIEKLMLYRSMLIASVAENGGS